MKFLRLRVDGFGPLQGEWTFAPDRANVIIDDNERGKSSLFAAIAAALYGLDGDKRSNRVITPLERWRPWSGSAYRVVLDVECASGLHTITRDFDRGTVAVFDRSGSEVTTDFLEGRDDFAVGKKLLGLDRDEFEKCAMLAHGDLAEVVPADEKARRVSTLKARLENAADTHIGDTNASEALRVLEEALRRYEAHELEFTGTIDNAIERLTQKRDTIEAEIRDLDATLIVAQAPLDDMHLLAEEERKLQDHLRDLENERRAGLAVEVRRQLEEHEAALAEVARLESEAGDLAGSANLPANVEGELREAIARHEEALRNLEGLESRRRDELAKEREKITRERKELEAFDAFGAEDADRVVAQAAELRHLNMQEALLRHQVFELRDALASKGYEPEKIQFMQQRFGGLPPDSARLLKEQAELNVQFQAEATTMEQRRAAATETLRDVDAARAAARTPGWILVSLGAASLLAGGVVLAMRGLPTLGVVLLGLGSIVAAAGGVVLGLGARARAADRDEALNTLAEAQSTTNALHRKRAENDSGLRDLARMMGHRDSVELMRQWSEYSRLLEDSGPLMRAQEQLESAEKRKLALHEHAGRWAKLVGETSASPELLDRVAADARRSLGARQRLAELERGFGWVEDEKRVLETAASAMKERALRLLQSAGITYDAAKGWPHHVNELKARMEGRVRHAMVADELIPAARRRLHPDHEVAQRRRQLDMLLAGGELPENARTSTEIELEVKQTRSKLEEAQRRRSDVRVEVEEVWRRHSQRRPDLAHTQERLGRAIERAQRFKQSVEIARDTIQSVARDTHRKWADFLNDRVGQILRAFGSSVQSVGFGEDLEFSVQLDGGPLVSRAKADAQLSAGARDQLYLAVRLAISEFISRSGEPVPLLIDDVFATSDDTRLRSGMRALLEGSGAGHQVLFATCHRGRMQELRRQDAGLFRERVHWVELKPGAGAQKG